MGMKHTAISQEILEYNHALILQSPGSRQKNDALVKCPSFVLISVFGNIFDNVTLVLCMTAHLLGPGLSPVL